MSDLAAAPALRTLANRVGPDWVPAAATDALTSRDPATGEPIARVPLSGAADVAAAVAAARAALPAWSATPLPGIL